MKNSIIDSFKSKIVIKISGRNIDNFINRLIKNHINIISMDYINYKEINICLYEKDYEKVLKLKSIYDVEEIDYSGLIKIKKLINYNKILLLSIMLGIALIYTLSLFIFNIEVVHDKEEIRNIILKELKYNGVDINKLKKSDKELEKIKNNIKEKYKDKIEWIEIIVSGTKYIVKVEERKINNIENDNTPRHIISKKDAIIKKISAQNGTPVVKEGEIVKKGTVLIAGWLEGKYTGTRYVHATGSVQGKVWYTQKERIYFKQQKKEQTGNVENKYSLNINNFKINFNKGVSKFKNYDTIETNKKVKLFSNFYLPIELIKITNTEVNITDITYTLEEAKNIGIEKAKQELNNKIENLDNILSIQINDSQTSEYIEVEVTYEMLENIGTKEKIVF